MLPVDVARECCGTMRRLALSSVEAPRLARRSIAAGLSHAGACLTRIGMVSSIEHFVDSDDGSLLVALPSRSLVEIPMSGMGSSAWSRMASCSLDRIEWHWREELHRAIGVFDARAAVEWRGRVNLHWVCREVWRRTGEAWPERVVAKREAVRLGLRMRGFKRLGLGDGNQFLDLPSAELLVARLSRLAAEDERQLDPVYSGPESLRDEPGAPGALPSRAVIAQLVAEIPRVHRELRERSVVGDWMGGLSDGDAAD